MPPRDAEDSSSSCGSSSVDDDDCSVIEESSKEEEENDVAGSQDTLSTLETFVSIDFLAPGGLSSFSAELPGRRSEEENAQSMKSGVGVENTAVGSRCQCHEEGRLNIVSLGRLLYHYWYLRMKGSIFSA